MGRPDINQRWEKLVVGVRELTQRRRDTRTLKKGIGKVLTPGGVFKLHFIRLWASRHGSVVAPRLQISSNMRPYLEFRLQ